MSETDGHLVEIVADILERIEVEGEDIVKDACLAYPELATAIQKRIRTLRDMGLVAESVSTAPEHPERLGEFHLLEKIGAGGMGVVYRAHQDTLGREVAVKLVRPDLLYFERTRDRFIREVETVARLQHPGIVPVHAVGESDGIPYFAMPLMRGCTLDQLLRHFAGRNAAELTGSDMAAAIAELSHGGDDASELSQAYVFEDSWEAACLHIGRQVVDALSHAHRHGILHRDIKPSNVIVTPEGRALLLDFGLATSGRSDGRITRSSSHVGSWNYMSPEAARGEARALDERSDIYSLGATLYELLTLQRAFPGQFAAEVLKAIDQGDLKPPRSINPLLSWEAETVTVTALEPDPPRRYASALDFHRDIDNVLSSRPIEARRASWFLRTQRWIQRHPARAVTMLLIFVVLIGGPVFYAIQEHRAGIRIQAERDDVLRLSAIRDIEDLLASADTLWPANLDLEKSYLDWISSAEDLVAETDTHLATLRRIEARGDPSDVPGEFSFSNTEDRWWHAQLKILLALIDELSDPEVGLIDGVHPTLGDGIRRRLHAARSIADQTLTSQEAQELWEDAADEIFLSEEYGELELAPQMGLLPIGLDPDSWFWEFWVVGSGDRPKRDENDELIRTPTMGIVLILIPSQVLWVGVQTEDPKKPAYATIVTGREMAAKEVELEPYFISKFEMTQHQYEMIMHQQPSYFPSGHPMLPGDGRLHPVEYVSWTDCSEAMRRAGLCLPTEEQWECACRAGTTTAWWTGHRGESVGDPIAANLADNYARTHSGQNQWGPYVPWDDGAEIHNVVGSYEANPFGLHDTIGNVQEWCGGEPLVVNLTEDGSNYGYAFRGGGFSSGTQTATSYHRSLWEPDQRYFNLGLRPARLVHTNLDDE